MRDLTIENSSSLTDRPRLGEIPLVHLITVSALILFFIADFSNKLLIHLHFNVTRVSIIPRSIFELFFLAVTLIFINKKRSIFLLIIVIMFSCFMVGQVIFSNRAGYTHNYIENILIYNKYFFAFIIYFGIYKLEDYPIRFNHCIRVMEMLFLINAYLTIAGFVFGIDVFRTYIEKSYRFGYSGILWVQNEATLLYFISISYFYYKRFILQLRSKGIYVILLASLLLGTKAIYLFLVMLLLFHFVYHSGLKTKIITIFLAILIYWFVSWFLKTQQAEILLAYFVSKMSTNGLWFMLFSGRTMYLEELSQKILDHWTIVNYLVGGQDQSRFMIEMDFFDLFLYFGLLGFIMYFILLFTSLFKFRPLKPFNLFFVISYMTLAFLAGHFFSSVINALYLCLVSMYFYVTQAKPREFIQ